MRMSRKDRIRLANQVTPWTEKVKDWLYHWFLVVVVIVLFVLAVRATVR